MSLPRIWESCTPRSDVLAGALTLDMFAAQLGQVVDGTAPAVYSDAATFFDNTFPTAGLKHLATEVFSRLASTEATQAPVIRLETSFGGGKTHSLIALYHLARHGQRSALAHQLVSTDLLPDEPVPVAAVVGYDLDPTNGILHGDTGITTMTLWGEIAHQLGGSEAYGLVRDSDSRGTPPSPDILRKVTNGKPALIMIDEIAHYLRAAKGVAVGKSDLAEQTVAFFHRLFECAASCPRMVVVFTLAESSDAFAKETEELAAQLRDAHGQETQRRETQRLAARQEIVLRPTDEHEYAPVVNHRLFERIDPAAAAEVAREYLAFYQRELERGVPFPHHVDSASYGESIAQAYPIHPELISVLDRKTSTIPNFQKTRGVLRLLAQVVRRIWEEQAPDAYLIQPHHVDLAVDAIRSELTSRLDRAAYLPVVEADIHSTTATPSHAQTIDADWEGKEKPPYGRRVAQTILLHSLVQGQASGAGVDEIHLACAVPGEDVDFVDQTIGLLTDTAWHIDFDERRYRFKVEPSINKIIEDEIDTVGRSAAKSELNTRIRSVYATKHFESVFFPEEAADVDDNAGKPKLAVLSYDSERVVSGSGDAPPPLVNAIWERAGTQGAFREFQNNVVFLVSGSDETEPMLGVAQRFLALQNLTKAERIQQFQKPQQEALRERRGKAELDLRVAVTRAYRHLFYPDSGGALECGGLSHHVLPIQDAVEPEKDQQAVLVRVLHDLNKVLTADDTPLSAAYVRDKAWPQQAVQMTTQDFQRAFCRKRTLPIVLVADQLKRTVKDGVERGIWVYWDGRTAHAGSTPLPPIQFSEDCVLYVPDEAKRLGLLKEPEPGVSETTQTTTATGTTPTAATQVPAGRGLLVVPLKGTGVPKAAFQQLRDACHDNKIESLDGVLIHADAVHELHILGLALTQVTDLGLSVSVEQGYTASVGSDSVDLSYSGTWERFGPLQRFVESFDRQMTDRTVTARVDIRFPEEAAPAGPEIDRIVEALTTLSMTKIEVEGVPGQGAGR